jgi:hypothetical protein
VSTSDRVIRLLPAAAGFALLGVALVLAADDGGYATTSFLPAALVVLGLLVAVALGVGTTATESRLLLWSIALFAAFTVFTFASIGWADDREIAWDGANRTFLYFCTFTFFAALPWTARTRSLLVGGWTLGVGAVAVYVFARGLGQSVDDWFVAGRLAVPIRYSNASAALFLMPIWPALYFASRREVQPFVRGAFFAAAGVFLQLALLAQSRTTLVAVPVIAVAYLVLVPGRVRGALAMTIVGLAGAASASTLLDVYPAIFNATGATEALRDARLVIVVTAVVLFVLGTALAFLDRRVRVAAPVARGANRAVIVGGLVAVVALVVAVLAVGNPVARAESAWRTFKDNSAVDESEGRLTGVSTNRYDLWRVAAEEFGRHPVVGIGSDNFAIPYLRERSTAKEEPLYPHSLAFKLLAQGGMVGSLLFAGFLGVALAAGICRWRRLQGYERGVALVAALVFGYWVVHGLNDWLWEIPALGMSAFAMLALSVSWGTVGPPRRIGTGGLAALLGVALVLGVGLAAPWVSARQVDLAARTWQASPTLAYERLDRARRLNPLADRPDVVAGIIARRAGEPERERRAFERALERNPYNWYAELQLAVVASQSGDSAEAKRRILRARALNPLEPALASVEGAIAAGRPIDAERLDRLFLGRATSLVNSSR